MDRKNDGMLKDSSELITFPELAVKLGLKNDVISLANLE